MATIQFENGQEVEVQGNPTAADVESIAGTLGIGKDSSQSQPPAEDQTPSPRPGYGGSPTKPQGSLLGIAEVPGGLARGVVQGGQEMLNTGANVNELLGSPLGKGPRNFVNESRAALDMLIPPRQSILGKMSEGIGQLPGMMATYGKVPGAFVLPEAAVLGAINSPEHNPESMIKGAAGNAIVMGLLGASQELAAKSVLKGAGMAAATTGGAALLSGQSDKDVIAQAALGAGFAMYPQESQDRFQKDYKMAGKFLADPKANIKGAFDLLKEDPVQRNMRIIGEKEAQLKIDLANRNSDLNVAQRQAIANAKNLTAEDQKAIDALKTTEQKRYDAEKLRTRSEQQSVITQWQQKEVDFNKNMPETARKAALYLQNNYKRFFGQATEQYGPQMDKVAGTIGEISGQNAFDILSSVLDKSINDYGSSDTSFAKKLFKLQDRYNPEANMPPELADLTPSQKQQIIAQNPQAFPEPPPVKFKEFYSDVRGVLDSLDPSEHNAAILRREVGKYIATKDESFQGLQDEYAHIVSHREELAKVFSPYDGPAAVSRGEDWLSNLGAGSSSTINATQRTWLDFMERGFKGEKIQMRGIGTDVSEQFGTLGDKLDVIKREIASARDENPVYSKYGSQMVDLALSHTREMEALEAKGKLTNEELAAKTAHIKDAIGHAKENALRDLAIKEQIYKKGRRNTNKIDEVRKRIEGLSGALGLGFAGAGLWKASRLFRAGLIARKSMRLRGQMR